jgi:hypothetical protein
MTPLELIKSACNSLGQPVPNSIQGSADAGVRQMLELLNDEGRGLSERFDWQAIIGEATFTTAAQEDQGSLTTIIGATRSYRYILNDTMFNRDRREPVCGPNSPIDWQLAKTLGLTGPFTTYRIRGDRLLFNSAPAAGEHIYFEYISENWATAADGVTYKSAITKDDDVFLLRSDLLLSGLKWRWRKAKSLDYTEEFNEYERKVVRAEARDGTARRVSMADRIGSNERRFAVPPGSWNL